MRDIVARNAIEVLQDDKKRTFGNEALKRIKAELLTYRDAAMESATDYYLLNSNTLPTAQQLLDRVKMEHDKISQSEAIERERQDLHDRKTAPKLSDLKPQSNHGNESLKLMLMLDNGEIDLTDYYVKAIALAEKYGQETVELVASWQRLKMAA